MRGDTPLFPKLCGATRTIRAEVRSLGSLANGVLDHTLQHTTVSEVITANLDYAPWEARIGLQWKLWFSDNRDTPLFPELSV